MYSRQIISCPSCGVQGKPGDCVDTLAFSERLRETFKRRGWAVTLNPFGAQDIRPAGRPIRC